MPLGNIPANSNSTGIQNTASNAPMSNFPSMNTTSTTSTTTSSTENSNTPVFQPKRKTPIKLIFGGIIFVLLLIGGAAGLYLTQMQQDVRQQASTGSYTCWTVSGSSCARNTSGTPCSPSGPRFSTESACQDSLYCDRSAPNTTQCTDKGVGSACRDTAGSSGSCQIVSAGGANTECRCQVAAQPSPSPTPGTGGGQCIALEQACGSEKGLSDTCCGNGVCQGPNGNRRCEDAQVPIDSLCGTGTCSGYYGFQCNSLHTTGSSSGQLVCEQNPSQLFTGPNARSQAVSYAGGCGQIDQVCVGGDKQGQLCGEFSIMNSCGGGTPPPTTPPTNPPSPQPTPSPTPSPAMACNSVCTTDAQCQAVDSRFSCVQRNNNKRCRLTSNPDSNTCQPAVGPMCLSISMNNLSNPTADSADPEIGDAITLTCGEVAEAQRYIFRITQANGAVTNLLATGRTSESFTIADAGGYVAQCQICTGASDDTCLPYEPID
jgi:hypothetical protein